MSRPPKIIFAGSPAFALPTLQALCQAGLRPCLVITMPDSKKGRGKKLAPTAVKQLAEQLQIKVVTASDINLLYPELQELQPDLLITVAYGGYLQAKIRKLPQYGCINLHPSLLPSYRGANPIKYPLLCGDKITGYSIFKIVAKMDAGAIYYQEKIAIDPTENFAQLHDKLAREGAKGMVLSVQKILTGDMSASEQKHSLATYTQKTQKEDTYIDWHNSAQELHNFVRAYSPSPGAIAFLQGKQLKILACQISEQKSTSAPGTVVEICKNEGFIVSTQDFDLLIKQVLPAGKKQMSAYAFTLGKTDLLGKNLSEQS